MFNIQHLFWFLVTCLNPLTIHCVLWLPLYQASTCKFMYLIHYIGNPLEFYTTWPKRWATWMLGSSHFLWESSIQIFSLILDDQSCFLLKKLKTSSKNWPRFQEIGKQTHCLVFKSVPTTWSLKKNLIEIFFL
jgi:hypothetical protein